VCASGGDQRERRGKLREMEMFWREIFREVCTHDYAYIVTSTCDTHGHVSTLDTNNIAQGFAVVSSVQRETSSK
jgi:hypothetical protein